MNIILTSLSLSLSLSLPLSPSVSLSLSLSLSVSLSLLSLTSDANTDCPIISAKCAYSKLLRPLPYLISGSASIGKNKFHKPDFRASSYSKSYFLFSYDFSGTLSSSMSGCGSHLSGDSWCFSNVFSFGKIFSSMNFSSC